ncbi:4Fe-4S dicluster domain-containing protein [Anaerotruncus sp. AF02-27]|uniref:SLBB domain-containing protein n=1 Tax=Anaerotruncus TaxID=244127 RepID=UPI000E4BA7D2|nr:MULTISPECIES: SLBB domain-containing protein [Anaerotruncus]RGX54810.1 4Fe-4S dicluster domain-containing protein [Anaerotruncus sp. AF02-27]
MAGFLYKGILLQQQKEPALSRDLREFFNADTIGVQMDREPVSDVDELTPGEIISIARSAKIIDERDGGLLADKLSECHVHPPKILIGDAIDDEPYISSQLNPLLKNQKLAADGLRIVQRAVDAQEAYFAVYKNLSDLEIKIPKLIGEYPVKRIRGRYPAEYQASKIFEGGEDVLTVGVGAVLHLARAVYYNKPQTTAFVTVAGSCVGNPTNLEVSLGMTVNQVLERCGLIDDPSRVIVGGSMTGISLIDTENTLVTPTTRAILAFRGEEKKMNFNCIGCSRCVHVCPEGLNPFFLYRSIKLHRFVDFRTLDAQMCIGCNTCSYMCPAKLDLSETIRQGQEEFRRMAGSMRAAAVAQARDEKADFETYMAQWQAGEDRRCQLRAERKAAREACRAEREAQREARRAEREAELEEKKREAREQERKLQEAALKAQEFGGKLEDLVEDVGVGITAAAVDAGEKFGELMDSTVEKLDQAIGESIAQDAAEELAQALAETKMAVPPLPTEDSYSKQEPLEVDLLAETEVELAAKEPSEAEPAVSKENPGEQVKAPAAKIASAPDMPNGGLEELVENAQEQRETAESTAGAAKAADAAAEEPEAAVEKPAEPEGTAKKPVTVLGDPAANSGWHKNNENSGRADH